MVTTSRSTTILAAAPASVLVAFLERGEPAPGRARPIDHRYVSALGAFGRAWLVRAAREAAAIALPVWEARHPDVDEPRRTVAALDRWLACPCSDCAASAAALKDPFGRPEDRPWTPFFVTPGRVASVSELAALDCTSLAARTPTIEPDYELEVMVAGTIDLAEMALMPEPRSAGVRERVWARLLEHARTELHGAPTTAVPVPKPHYGAQPPRRGEALGHAMLLGPVLHDTLPREVLGRDTQPNARSPLASIRALELDAVRPALDEIVQSTVLARKLRRVSTTAHHPTDPRALVLFSAAQGSLARFLDDDLRTDAWSIDGRLLGTTLVVEAVEPVVRAVHPQAGVFLFTAVFDVTTNGVELSSRAAFVGLRDRRLHVIERVVRPAAREISRHDVANHVLDALGAFDRDGAL